MQVSQIVKKVTESYIDKFKKDPEAMAWSYAWLAAAWGLSYAGLILAIKELDQRDRQLADIISTIDRYNAYIDGMNDAYDIIKDRLGSCESKNSYRETCPNVKF